MKRETLSNNTEYQKRLREARIKGSPHERIKLRISELDTERSRLHLQLQQQVSVTIGQISIL